MEQAHSCIGSSVLLAKGIKIPILLEWLGFNGEISGKKEAMRVAPKPEGKTSNYWPTPE